MKLHANARTCPKSRRLLVKRVEEGGWSLAAAAEAAGVSERTAHKWLGRWRADGEAGLEDRSSAPKTRPTQLPASRVQTIEALRRLRMTAAEIAECLGMALSTVSRWLKRIGLGKRSRLEPDSFGYLVDRTLMRPRDLLNFLQEAHQVAVNRGDAVITAADFLHSEAGYSESSLLALGYEIEDTHPGTTDALYAFQNAPSPIGPGELEQRLQGTGLDASQVSEVRELLLWFGFLGIRLQNEAELYSHSVRFNLRRLTQPVDAGTATFVVHPAFRPALGIEG